MLRRKRYSPKLRFTGLIKDYPVIEMENFKSQTVNKRGYLQLKLLMAA
jgi:hypothetical protein